MLSNLTVLCAISAIGAISKPTKPPAPPPPVDPFIQEELLDAMVSGDLDAAYEYFEHQFTILLVCIHSSRLVIESVDGVTVKFLQRSAMITQSHSPDVSVGLKACWDEAIDQLSQEELDDAIKLEHKMYYIIAPVRLRVSEYKRVYWERTLVPSVRMHDRKKLMEHKDKLDRMDPLLAEN